MNETFQNTLMFWFFRSLSPGVHINLSSVVDGTRNKQAVTLELLWPASRDSLLWGKQT